MTDPLPRFGQPWPPEISPHDVEELVTRWAVDSGLVTDEHVLRRFRSMRFGRCAALTSAHIDLESLVLSGKWLVWIFVLDDTDARTPQEWEAIRRQVMAVLHGERDVADTPRNRTLAELREATFARMSPALRARLASHVDYLLDGCVREAGYRPDALPDPDTYVDNRRRNSGMYLFADVLEMALDTEVPAALYDTAVFRDLLDAVTDIGAWQNDIISLDAEEARGELSNFVTVLRLTRGMSRDTAVRAVREMITARIADFDAGEQELPRVLTEAGVPAEDHAALLSLVEEMRQWVNGFLFWSYETKRYADPSIYRPAEPLLAR